VSLFYRIVLSVISAVLYGMVASTVCILLELPAAAPFKELGPGSHGLMLVSFRDAPLFVGLSVFLAILCRDARSEYLNRN
jgi:hypothetical protein